MSDEHRWYLGVDWGSEQDQVCLLRHDGTVVGQRSVRHRAADISACLRWLRDELDADLSCLAVAIERPHCALADALIEQGAEVFHLNPKQTDSLRDRYSTSGAKDDRRDAYVLADSLRLQPRGFLRVLPEEPRLVELRATSRLDDQLQVQISRLANQLRAQLAEIWPELLALSPAANEPWLWSLLQLASSPEQARTLRRSRLAALLEQHRIRRFGADELAAALHEVPIPAQAGKRQAAALILRMLSEQLQLMDRQRKLCGRHLEALLDELSAAADERSGEHRDAAILCSLPGAGKRVSAAVLAEAPHAVAQRDYKRLRIVTGVAPVTHSSGKSKRVVMRRACNHRLRHACYFWAMNAIRNDASSRRYYDALRQRGHGHPRALRSVADRLLRIFVAMLESGTTYQHAAA